MKDDARKAAISAYKERKSVAGVFIIRCATSSKTWIGHWVDIETIQNRIWFTLRQGTHPNRQLQEAWGLHGEAQFSFEIVEQISAETTAYLLATQLKDRCDYWRQTLCASSI